MRVKILLPIVVLLMLLPFTVFAKESCKMVSENGKDIGSEIACGSEHFYIIENNSDYIKMISKYNLYVGTIYDKIKLDINNTYVRNECNGIDSCYGNAMFVFEGEQVNNHDEWVSRILDKYNLSEIYSLWNNNGSIYSSGNIALYDYVYSEQYEEGNKSYKKYTYKLYPYTSITRDTSGYALQNKLALGVTGEKGNAKYPLYGTLTLFPDGGGFSPYINLADNFENGYTNFEFKNDSNIKQYLNDYYSKLSDMGYDITSVDMINMKQLYDLVYSVSKKNLPLSTWYNDSLESNPAIEDNNEYYTLGDLKEYLTEDYSWLWNTSYWTKTLVGNSDNITDDSGVNVYFVSSSGEICYSATDCFSGIPRAGIRPIVTINKKNIKYKIITKTDGNGTIEVVDSAFGGDKISFRVSAKKGLKLAGLTVTTDSNEKVEFKEEDISVDKTGIYSISTNKFTMPYENVTIEARWTSASIISNPKTGDVILSIIFIVLFSIVTSTCINKVLNKNNA